MRHINSIIFILIHGVAVLTGCDFVEKDINRSEDAALPVQLSFALSSNQGPSITKATSAYITELAVGENSFRGMEEIRILPFSGRDEVTGEEQSIGFFRPLPSIGASIDEAAVSGYSYHNGLVRNNHAHLYSDAFAALPKGTASVLIYGRAPLIEQENVQQEKHLNGSLIESGMDTEWGHHASDFGFSPDPIFSGVFPTEATRISEILTHIAQSVTYSQTFYYYMNGVWYEGHTSVNWNENIADQTLKEYYRWFTGGGELMTGAGSSVEYLLSMLYGRLNRYESFDEEPVKHMVNGVEYATVLTEGGSDTCTNADLYNGLCDAILERFQDLIDSNDLALNSDGSLSFVSAALKNYPTFTGLPAGASVLRWNGIRYSVVTEGLDGIAAIDHYCYMPPLYYFVNSTISTSSETDVAKWYTSDTDTWNQILGTYRQGKVVNVATRSVALDNPMQFAVAQLAATVKATVSLIPDNDGDPRTNCSVSGTNFPITGILIGRQHQQTFDFVPVPDSEEYYLYDNQFTGIYLTTAESPVFRSLVLPVPAGEDVYIFLELRNDSGAIFTGAEGMILPGNYFYLAGKLDKSEDPAFPQVFMSDHVTTAKFIISSFENAHVAVPEMSDPTLVMGVQSTVNWIMAASSYVVLD